MRHNMEQQEDSHESRRPQSQKPHHQQVAPTKSSKANAGCCIIRPGSKQFKNIFEVSSQKHKANSTTAQATHSPQNATAPKYHTTNPSPQILTFTTPRPSPSPHPQPHNQPNPTPRNLLNAAKNPPHPKPTPCSIN